MLFLTANATPGAAVISCGGKTAAAVSFNGETFGLRLFCDFSPVPLLLAANPPPKSIMPTLIRLKPIISTTIPLTVGVITRRK